MTNNPILQDVDTVVKFVTSSDKAQQVADTAKVARAAFNLLAGFLINVQRIADAQEQKKPLLDLEQTANPRKV